MLAMHALTLNYIGDGDTEELFYDNLYVYNLFKNKCQWFYELLTNRNKFVIKI